MVAAACGLSETTGFLAGSAAWTARMEGVGLGLLGKEDWLSLEEGARELVGIKDLLGRRELVVVIAIVVVVLVARGNPLTGSTKERDLGVGGT